MPDDAQHVLYCDECLKLDASDDVRDPWDEAEEDE
jgi:hypothetical protein